MNILEYSLGPKHFRAEANPFHATLLALCSEKRLLFPLMNPSRKWESNTEFRGEEEGHKEGVGG